MKSCHLQGDISVTGLLSSQPVRLLIGLMGGPQAVVHLKAGLQVLSSLADATAIYTLMAALTCTVQLQMGSSSWIHKMHSALQA